MERSAEFAGTPKRVRPAEEARLKGQASHARAQPEAASGPEVKTDHAGAPEIAIQVARIIQAAWAIERACREADAGLPSQECDQSQASAQGWVRALSGTGSLLGRGPPTLEKGMGPQPSGADANRKAAYL